MSIESEPTKMLYQSLTLSGGEYFDALVQTYADSVMYSAAIDSPDNSTVKAALDNDTLPEFITLRTDSLRETILSCLVEFGASTYVQGGRDAIMSGEDLGGEFDNNRFVPRELLINLVELSRDEAGSPLIHKEELIEALKSGQGILIVKEPTDSEIFGEQGEQ